MLKTTARHARNGYPAPRFGETLEPCHPSDEMAGFLLRRRSTRIKDLAGPGPTAAELTLILRAGSRVPDHGKLAPFRFLTFRGAARKAFGEVLAGAWKASAPQCSDDLLDFERKRPLRAPVVVAVISRVRENHKIPEWEQTLSAGAACQTMLIMGQALGFAGVWLTEWCAYDPMVKRAMGLESGERVAGFLYFGTAQDKPVERARPEIKDLVQAWKPAE